MCIIFFITANDLSANNNGYKLILASNRDEFYGRPTKAASPWQDKANHVIAGKDMENGKEGGTWLGISAKENCIKVGALLNLPGEVKLPDALGRGPIVADYLTGELNNFDYSDRLLRSKVQFNAFNFVSIEFNENNKHCQILHTSNVPRGIKEFPNDQVQGFSNSGWASPLKKVDHGKELFTQVVNKSQAKEELVSDLMNLLSNRTQFPDDEELKRRVYGYEAEYSPVFVSIPEVGYGSRTKTVILVDNNNKMDFYEETLEQDNSTWSRTHIERQLL